MVQGQLPGTAGAPWAAEVVVAESELPDVVEPAEDVEPESLDEPELVVGEPVVEPAEDDEPEPVALAGSLEEDELLVPEPPEESDEPPVVSELEAALLTQLHALFPPGAANEPVLEADVVEGEVEDGDGEEADDEVADVREVPEAPAEAGDVGDCAAGA